MKTTFLKTGALLLAVSVFATACKKDSNSNGSTSSQMSFAVTADNSSTTVNSVNGPATQSTETNATVISANITWTSAVANISHFKLEAKKNGSEVEVTSNSLTNVDLLAVPASITAKIDTGTYREIEIKVLLVKSSGTDIPLTLKGTYNGAAGAVPIEVDFNETATFKAEAENVTVTNVEDVTAKLTVHLNRILNGITAAQLSAAAKVDGKIVISNTVNASLYAAIAARVDGFFTSGGFEKHHH